MNAFITVIVIIMNLQHQVFAPEVGLCEEIIYMKQTKK